MGRVTTCAARSGGVLDDRVLGWACGSCAVGPSKTGRSSPPWNGVDHRNGLTWANCATRRPDRGPCHASARQARAAPSIVTLPIATPNGSITPSRGRWGPLAHLRVSRNVTLPTAAAPHRFG